MKKTEALLRSTCCCQIEVVMACWVECKMMQRGPRKDRIAHGRPGVAHMGVPHHRIGLQVYGYVS